MVGWFAGRTLPTNLTISLIMDTIKLSEAKAHLGRYTREVAKGKQITITDRNRAVAILSGVSSALTGIRPKVGLMDGKVSIPDDFDAPLKGFEKDFYAS